MEENKQYNDRRERVGQLLWLTVELKNEGKTWANYLLDGELQATLAAKWEKEKVSILK